MTNPSTSPDAGMQADLAAAMQWFADWLPYLGLTILVAAIVSAVYRHVLKAAWRRINPHRSRRLDFYLAGGSAALLVVSAATAYAIEWADHEGRDWLAAGLFLGLCALIVASGFALKAWLDRRSRRG